MNARALQQLAREVESIARRAGAAILEIYAQEFDVSHKADASPLTAADLASHHLIRDELARLTPDLPFLSEESSAIDYAARAAWREYWLVDPLDGTKEFVSRNGEFTVNIALVRDHEPALGVVFVPVSGVSYAGAPSLGAWRTAPGRSPEAIAVRRPCGDPVVVVGSRSHANPVLERLLTPLGRYELVNMGSALKICRVAEGMADLYARLGPTSEWDTAAAHAVVAAAGGQVVTLDGAPLRYNCKESLRNPEFIVFADTERNFPALFRDYRPG